MTENIKGAASAAPIHTQSLEIQGDWRRSATGFCPADIRQMVSHDEALEKYKMLSAQILNRWIKAKAIRRFKGRESTTWYFEPDLSKALSEDMEWQNCEGPGGSSNIETNGLGKSRDAQVSTDIGMMTEVDALKEKRSLQLIWGQQRTNLSKSSPTTTSRPRPHHKSS